MSRYTLFELERLTGILAPTIRVWERRYNIIKPKRTDTNRRWYNDEDLTKLINISILYHSGIKISQIARYSGSELQDKAEFLTRDSFVSDSHVKSLIVAMLSFDTRAVNEIMLKSIINIGFEETYSNVVFPFLRRVGIMWHTGSADTGAEHFVTNIFRTKLIFAIESLPQVNNPKSLRILMFLPENELHEMGLLFYSFLIRKKGHEVLYLGQSTPFSALTEAREKWNPDILVTGVLSDLSIAEPEKYLSDLSSIFRSGKILVCGSLADEPVIEKFQNIYPVRSATDLRKHI
jgi:DNA-binding transcriptional MerR regulator